MFLLSIIVQYYSYFPFSLLLNKNNNASIIFSEKSELEKRSIFTGLTITPSLLDELRTYLGFLEIFFLEIFF